MAEFLEVGTKFRQLDRSKEIEDGFNAMGKPIPMFRRQAAINHCRQMGLTNTHDAWSCVGAMSNALERDEPYTAMEAGMRYLDLTGTYRLMAVLLTAHTDDNVVMRTNKPEKQGRQKCSTLKKTNSRRKSRR